MRKYLVILVLLALGSTFSRAADETVNPFTGKNTGLSAEERKKVEDEIKEAERRVKITTQQIKGKNHVNLKLDNLPILELPGTTGEATIEGVGNNRALVARIDGKEVARVPFPDLKVKAADLPPLMLKDINSSGVRCESQTINGVSSTTVWVDGKIVYQGPGSNSSTKSRSVNGQKSVEVIVDGKVIYHATEAAK